MLANSSAVREASCPNHNRRRAQIQGRTQTCYIMDEGRLPHNRARVLVLSQFCLRSLDGNVSNGSKADISLERPLSGHETKVRTVS